MAKGWDKVEQATQAAQEARARAAANSLPQIYTSHVDPAKGGTPVRVRFLEQGPDVNNYGRHEYQVPDGRGGFYRRQFTCLKEAPWSAPECPGCTAGLKIKTRGVYNVIQRMRAVLRKGADNRAIKGPDGKYIIDGHADQVVILDVPSTTAEVLRGKDGTYHGLMSRDLMLSASGNSFSPWTIEPADIDGGPQPMSENDQALAAAKHNLDEFMKPPSFQEAAQIVAQYGGNSGAGSRPPAASPQGTAAQAGAANNFLAGAPVAQGGVPASAFGAAQQAPPTVAPPVQAQEQQPAPAVAPPPQAPAVPAPTQ